MSCSRSTDFKQTMKEVTPPTLQLHGNHTHTCSLSVTVSSQKATAHWHKYVAPMVCVNIILHLLAPTAWRFFLMKYGTMSAFKIKMGRGLRTIRIIGHLRLSLAPQMTDPPSFAHLLLACRHSMAGGLRLNIWWKKGHVLNLHLDAKTKIPRWIRRFCLHFSGNNGCKVISFPV